MRALSIRQPWAWLIVNGFKDIENRDWETLYRGWILVHAGQTLTKADYAWAVEFVRDFAGCAAVIPPLAELERGGIVGAVTITSCVRESSSPWFMGPFGFQLADAVQLPFRAVKGQLKFFDVPFTLRELADSRARAKP